MFKRLLGTIGRLLEKAGIPYMIIGGQAVLLYGEPRLTKDIDVTLGVGVEALPKIQDLSDRAGWKVLVAEAEDFVGRTMVLPVADPESGIRIDFIFSHLPYERQAIGRARAVKLGRNKVKFASLEDVVLHKIVAGRPRDTEDIRSILLKNPGFDAEYIDRWLGEFEAALGEDFRDSFRKITDDISG